MKGTDSGSRLRKAFAEASMSGMTFFFLLAACLLLFNSPIRHFDSMDVHAIGRAQACP
jgi:hypothetical protein